MSLELPSSFPSSLSSKSELLDILGSTEDEVARKDECVGKGTGVTLRGEVAWEATETGGVELEATETGRVELEATETGGVEWVATETGGVETKATEAGEVETEVGSVETEETETGWVEREATEIDGVEMKAVGNAEVTEGKEGEVISPAESGGTQDGPVAAVTGAWVTNIIFPDVLKGSMHKTTAITCKYLIVHCTVVH